MSADTRKERMATGCSNPFVLVAVFASILAVFAACASEPGTRERQLALVVEKGANQVTFIDRQRQEIVGAVVTGVGPHQLAVHPGSGLAVVSNYGSVESAGASLTVIDLNLMRAIRTIGLGRFRRPHGIQFLQDGRRVFLASEEGRTALVVDVEQAAILQMIPTGRVACREVVLSPDQRTAYGIAAAENELVVIDVPSSQLLQIVSLPLPVDDLAISSGGDELWLVSRTQESILVINTRNLETSATIPCPGGPIRIRFLGEGIPGSGDVLVSLGQVGGLAFFSSTERSEVGRLPLNLSPEEAEYMPGIHFTPVPVELALDERNEQVYVTSSNTDLVSVIDPLSLSVVRRIQVGDEPEGIAIIDLITADEHE